MKKILFVCLGNICRSPAAEAVLQEKLKKMGLVEKVYCDSAGTSAYHSGEKADSRMREHGKLRGYELLSISRQFEADDFDEFDLILAMDRSNNYSILKLAKNDGDKDKVKMMTSFCSKHKLDDVPDPYFGGDKGFEYVYEILEDACEGLLKQIKEGL